MRAIARHGLAKLGMRDVSESAGVSRGTLYRYFSTREDLLTGLVREEVRRFRDRVLTTMYRVLTDQAARPATARKPRSRRTRPLRASR